MSGSVFLGQTELRIEETAGTASLTIRRAGSLAGDVTVTYGATPISATAGADFTLPGSTVVIPDGQDSVTVAINILDDALGEATESFTFALISAEGANLSAPRTARVSILDDETPAPPPPEEPPLASDYEIGFDFLVGGLTQPVRFVFNPADPNQVFIAEKGGIVRVANLQTGESSVFLDISDRVNEAQDRGLLGIALHPDFAGNGFVYLYYTVDPPETAGLDGNAGRDGGGNRYNVLERFVADAATGYATPVPGSGTILLGGAARGLIDVSGGGELDFTDPGNESFTASDRYIDPDDPDPPELVGGFKEDFIKIDSRSHIGGALRFGPDGALYLSIGDGISFNYIDPRGPDVQSLDSLSGKVLRIDPLTGDGLADNPFVTPGLDLDSNRAKIYQLGLRNPFSMAVDDSGRIVLTDVGQGGWEEINSGGPGANFGWPFTEGVDGGVNGQTPGYGELPEAQEFFDAVARGDIVLTAPLRAFSHAAGDPGFQLQSIVAGSVVYSGGQYPAEFLNDLFFSDFLTGNLFTVDIDASEELRFIGEAPGLIHLEQGPDGFLYAANIYGGTISRLTISPIVVTPQDLVAIGDASLVGAAAREYRLTPPEEFAVGGVAGTTRVDLRQDARFVFELNFGAEDVFGADGAAFVLHNDPAGRQALGGAGEFLGLYGLANAVGIEFDTYQNGAGDPANDHSAIVATGIGGFGGANGVVDLGNLEDGAWHRIEVSWNEASRTLSYSVDGVLRDSRLGTLDAALGGSPLAWFAVTAATGGFLTEHRLRMVAVDVTYEDVAAAQAPVILGGFTRRLEVAEGVSGTLLSASATDAEGGAITWSITGTDAARFTVNAATGAVAFLATPDFEAPADADGDNLYRFTLRATDSGGLSSAQAVEIRVTDGPEILRGTRHAEVLDGTGAAEQLSGEAGADTVNGLGGADTILAQRFDGNDRLAGGAGTDTYDLSATSSPITASLATGRSTSSQAGADTLEGIENLTGGYGADRLSGDDLANILRGGNGADTLTGAGGNDLLAGDTGSDRLDGSAGADTMIGGANNDTYIYRDLGDVIVEEAQSGLDLVIAARGYVLPDHVEQLQLSGSARDGTGNGLANLITGTANGNRLSGLGGADTLRGGEGADTLSGGTGADAFLYGSAAEGGDILLDYVAADDRILVSAAGFGGGLTAGINLVATGRIVSRADGLSTAPAGTGQFVYETDTGLLRWDADGSGAGAAVVLADLSRAVGWTNAEVIVIA
jgi:glucose/arabinose dehydrogenase